LVGFTPKLVITVGNLGVVIGTGKDTGELRVRRQRRFFPIGRCAGKTHVPITTEATTSHV
jgi:hypothetical protein